MAKQANSGNVPFIPSSAGPTNAMNVREKCGYNIVESGDDKIKYLSYCNILRTKE